MHDPGTAAFPLPLLAQANGDDGSNAALVAFGLYVLGVLFIAWLSSRMQKKRGFLSEYFLGSRSLGVWAFALTFAATASSGGSFMGFPSKVYTHGWILALWIGSYMVVPIFVMGLMSKRLNQVARKTGAITIPDVLRDRFDCAKFGALSILLIVFFMSVNLVAQFKAGSMILQTLLADVPIFRSTVDGVAGAVGGIWFVRDVDPGYLTCLAVFAAVVVVYTTYGGFRAVVWTDVLQGFVMVLGIAILLPLALWKVGGLENATQSLARMTPPLLVELELATETARGQDLVIPKGTWLELVDPADGSRRIFRTKRRATIESGKTTATLRTAGQAGFTENIPAIEITVAEQIAEIQVKPLDARLTVSVLNAKDYEYGGGRRGVYVTGPGPAADEDRGFLPLSLAVSFFFMWAFSGAGQPSYMVRMMAFKSSDTLRKAIFTVSIYYSLIYFPIVIIFCCARVFLPGWEIDSDRIMPEVAKTLTAAAGWPWLAGLLVAAPFAAVMSTMDSFLLMISSALVRDVYQRHINPGVSEKNLRRLTYVATLTVGVGAMFGALNPPAYLQDIIVYTGSGLAACFLAPVFAALYWPRANATGAFAGMAGGFICHLSLYAGGFWMYQGFRPIRLFNFDPILPGLVASAVLTVVVTLRTAPPPEAQVRKFFYR